MFFIADKKTLWHLKRRSGLQKDNKMSSSIVRRKKRNGISLKKVNISKEIATINQLKSQGLISEEEFEKAKQKILKKEMVSH